MLVESMLDIFGCLMGVSIPSIPSNPSIPRTISRECLWGPRGSAAPPLQTLVKVIINPTVCVSGFPPGASEAIRLSRYSSAFPVPDLISGGDDERLERTCLPPPACPLLPWWKCCNVDAVTMATAQREEEHLHPSWPFHQLLWVCLMLVETVMSLWFPVRHAAHTLTLLWPGPVRPGTRSGFSLQLRSCVFQHQETCNILEGLQLFPPR